MKKVKYRIDRFFVDLGWVAETVPRKMGERIAMDQLHQFQLLDPLNTYRLTKIVEVTAEEVVIW